MLTEREMGTKVCSKCKSVKLLEAFPKDKSRKDGHYPQCKVCKKECDANYRAANPDYHAEYYAANPEKKKEYAAKWAKANPEKIKEIQAKYRAANPEKLKERNAEYHAANPEKRKESQDKWCAANPDYPAEYQKANPEKCRANTSNRRAAKLKAIPKWLTKEDWQAMEDIGKEAKRIELETGIKMHVDHIHPLKGRLICGLQCPTNLQILTAAQNCSKGNKFKPYVESES